MTHMHIQTVRDARAMIYPDAKLAVVMMHRIDWNQNYIFDSNEIVATPSTTTLYTQTVYVQCGRDAYAVVGVTVPYTARVQHRGFHRAG